MILFDAGPLVALFDAQDDAHQAARSTLENLREPRSITVSVLTEAWFC